jgi:hypothetical protein
VKVTEMGESKERMASSEKRLDGIQNRVTGILRRGECSMVKLYVSEFFTAKHVKWKRA